MDSLERLNAEVITCRKCPRLVRWREKVAAEKRAARMSPTEALWSL